MKGVMDPFFKGHGDSRYNGTLSFNTTQVKRGRSLGSSLPCAMRQRSQTLTVPSSHLGVSSEDTRFRVGLKEIEGY